MQHYKDAYEQVFNTTFKSNTSVETASKITNNTFLLTIDWNAEMVDDVLSENPLCSHRLFLLVLVASAPENFEHRDTIRKTWANPKNKSPTISGLKTKTIFLIGRTSSRFLNALLKTEKEISNDILLGDYRDTYRNLTQKVVHGLRWASSHCQSSYTLKTDDDCFVNVPLLLYFLWKHNPIESNLYAGHVRWSSPVIRNPNSRWYVSESDFQGSRFVPYVNGAGYVLSLDVLRKFVKFSGLIKFFPNEDAFVGTVLNMAGVRPTYSARFVAHSAAWQMCNFLYLFVVHHVKPTRQFEFQKFASEAWEECSLSDMAHDWV
ncbi:Beta-1 like protein [Argiope bruennichi]|uniref:Hexosyltransferase n=2 Tax=Argiope bruennichi TaxID=94029 RepID=A0A8T0EMT5_ARGBR|nr:Beta-1 like protein [Argiope bruennichi]